MKQSRASFSIIVLAFPLYSDTTTSAEQGSALFSPTSLFFTFSERRCTRSVSNLRGAVRWRKQGTERFKYTGKILPSKKMQTKWDM